MLAAPLLAALIVIPLPSSATMGLLLMLTVAMFVRFPTSRDRA